MLLNTTWSMTNDLTIELFNKQYKNNLRNICKLRVLRMKNLLNETYIFAIW